MNLAVAIVVLFAGSALVWVAAHGTEATTPWAVYQQIMAGLGGSTSAGSSGIATPAPAPADASGDA